MPNEMIKKIVLDLEGVEISLTSEQAEKLYQALNDLYGFKVIKEKEFVPYNPYPYRPYWAWQWDVPQYTWSCSSGHGVKGYFNQSTNVATLSL